MAVFRVERNKGYTVMSNHHLRNKELSLKAKGLLSQMLSLPEDWDYTLAGLSFINREKIDAIREAVKELERAGYIVRSRERDEKGRLRGTDYVIFEQPQTPPVSDLPTLENPTLDNPTLEKPTQEKPTLENPMQLNKDIQKTDLPKKEKSNTDLSSTDSIPIHSLNPLPYDGEAATPPERKRKEATDAYSVYEEIIKDNIEYDHFVRYGQVDKDRLDEDRYEQMSQKYSEEYYSLKAELEQLREQLSAFENAGGRAQKFVKLIDRYADFTDLTPTILNEFISRIEVHERDKKRAKQAIQHIGIYFNHIGRFENELTQLAEPTEQEIRQMREEIEEARKEKSRAYHRNYSREYRARNLEKRREYDRIKAREYRAKKKAQAAAALSAP